MNQTVLVTGAAGNLGQAVVRQFLSGGAKVIATTLSHEKMDAFANNPSFIHHALDVTDETAVSTFMAQLIREHAEIHVSALLVGGFAMGSIQETTGADLDKLFTLNFKSAYFLAKELFIQMSKQSSGGRLFFVGARPAIEPAAGKSTVAYALSKSLVFQLAELLNAEGKKKNVVAAVIVPSIIDTPLNRDSMPDANVADWVKPEEIARCMAFAAQTPALREPVFKLYGGV